jgi:hypothetical protein
VVCGHFLFFKDSVRFHPMNGVRAIYDRTFDASLNSPPRIAYSVYLVTLVGSAAVVPGADAGL